MENIADKVEAIADELKKRQDESEARIDRKLEAMHIGIERNAIPGGMYSRGENKSIGDAFVQSKEFKSMMTRHVWDSDPYEVKDLISSYPGSAADLIIPQRVPGIIAEPERVLTIRDLLAIASTESNTIDFMRETFTNMAAPVAESQEGYEGEVSKPESAISYDKDSAMVVTLAHWVPATRQVIADAKGLASYINTRLIYGLRVIEEDQLLNGTGGDELQGILDLATDFDTGMTAPDDTQLDTLRRAILQVRLAGYPATGIVLHPTDWADVELLKDSEERYLWGSVTEGGVLRTWRVPVVESEAIAEGSFLVGAFKTGAQIWDRQQASVRISEHHADFFVKNMVAILAEERLALAVYRPAAFVKGTFAEYGEPS